jgi:hypothetical protein
MLGAVFFLRVHRSGFPGEYQEEGSHIPPLLLSGHDIKGVPSRKWLNPFYALEKQEL